jgi:hypothetical protein
MFISASDITRNDIVVTFKDYTFTDDFNNLTNWIASQWRIFSANAYSGNSCVGISYLYAIGANIKTRNAIPVPAGEKVFVNFMVKFIENLRYGCYIDFSVSDNNSTWRSIDRIRKTADWENFSYVISEDIYAQLYFKFTYFAYDDGWGSIYQPEDNFYLDLFCVSVGSASVPDIDIVDLPRPVFSIKAYPNPFNPETTFSFVVGATPLSEGGKGGVISSTLVSIDIFNIKGQKVRELVNDYFTSGEHKVIWNGTDDKGVPVGSGVYFYRMKSGDYVETKKIVLMK